MQSNTLQLAYGDESLSVDIPPANLVGVFYPQESKRPSEKLDETDILRHALEHPIGAPPLRQLVKPGDKVAIITSDLTRPCPSERLIPPIISELTAASIPDADITIITALGLHRPMTADEIDRALTPEIHRRFRVLNHDIDDTVRLGVTSAGTPVEIFRPVVEADVRICLGNLEFHYFAGYSGGAKAILPGCASRPAVTANHAMMIRPEAAAGVIEGNPVRSDLEEAVAMLGVDFIFNVVVDGSHNILDAVAGDVIAAHRHGCELIASRGKVPVPHKADIVLASAGGFPKDINLYQAHKGLENASYFVREGGVIILAAECREGFGSQVFEEWMLSANSPREILDRIQRQFVLGGHKAAAIAAIETSTNVYLVSSMPDDLVRCLFMTPFASIPEALEAAFKAHGPASQVLVLPQAGSTLPEFERQ
jgi:nickel-dependent lactate racemase